MNSAPGFTLSGGQRRIATCLGRKQISAESLGKVFDLLHIHSKKRPGEELTLRDVEGSSLAKMHIAEERFESLG